MAERKYVICYVCRIICCNSKNCESPQPICQSTCNDCIDEKNVHYDFCPACNKSMMVEFECGKSKPKLLPKKIRVEEHDDGA